MAYRSRDEKEQDEKDEKRLQKMGLEELKAELDTRMKDSLIEEIKELPERIDRHLSQAAWDIICAAMGVKKDTWHDSKWEIESSSKGTALAVALGEHALQQVQMAIPGFVEGLVVGDPKLRGVKAAYKRSYKEHLAELLNQKVWEVAHKQAEERFVEIMEKITGDSVDEPESEVSDESEDDAA